MANIIATAGADSGDRQDFVLHKQNAAENNRPTPAAQAISAELIGSHACSALCITARGYAPVTKLCRRLIEAGHDPALPLLAYRGTTLCLRVRSIGEGARLMVEDNRQGTPRFRRRAQRVGAASYIAQIRKAPASNPERAGLRHHFDYHVGMGAPTHSTDCAVRFNHVHRGYDDDNNDLR
jgi:hypothetical protein